jgi:hypothetical protein
MIPPLPSPQFKKIPSYYPGINIFSEHDSEILSVYNGILTVNPSISKSSTIRYISLDGELVHTFDRVSGRVLLDRSMQMITVRAVLNSFESLLEGDI